jgi:outer membrane immunogenic protein
MKKYFILISLALITVLAFSQNPLYKGSSQLNAGFGLSDAGVPVYVGFDHAISRDVTLGAEFSFRAYNDNWTNNYYNNNIIGISGNANYHFNNLLHISSRWDLYAGANLGFYIWNSPDGSTGNISSRLGLGGQLGVRYYFTNSFGINLEFGGGNAFNGGKLGLSFRL